MRLPRAAILPAIVSLMGLLALPSAVANQPIPELRSVEVLIQPPQDNFAFLHNDRIVYGSASPKGLAGPVVASDPLTLFFSLMVNAAAAANTADFVRDLGPKVRASVEPLDVKATAEGYVRQLAPGSGPRLTVATVGLAAAPGDPEPSGPVTLSDFAGHRQAERVRARAMTSTQDALLFVQILPLFHLHSDHVRVYTHAQLVSKMGRRLLDWHVTLFPADVSKLAAAEVPAWWTEGNYLRFMLHGIQASLLMVIDDLADLPAAAERERQTEAVRALRNERGRPGGVLQSHAVLESRLRTSVCAVAPQTTAVRYRFAVGFHKRAYSAVALCPDEPLEDVYQRAAPFLAWSREAGTPQAVMRRAPTE